MSYPFCSPSKKVKSPAKALQFRSPRKRLQIDDASPSKVPGSPSKGAKRCRLLAKLRDDADPTTALHSLNKDQLLSLLSRAMTNDEVRAQISSQIPVPDLQRMEVKLQQRLKIVLSCTGGKQQLSPSVSYKKMHPSLDAFKLKLTSHIETLSKGELFRFDMLLSARLPSEISTQRMKKPGSLTELSPLFQANSGAPGWNTSCWRGPTFGNSQSGVTMYRIVRGSNVSSFWLVFSQRAFPLVPI